MANHNNNNRNEQERTDHNQQSPSKMHGGELRNGRLSQIKNHNPQDESIPNEYVNKAKQEENNEDPFEFEQEYR